MIILQILSILLLLIVILFALSIITCRLKWALLVSKSKLPAILLRPHNDWWPIFKWIPRRISALVGGKPPKQLFGSNPKNHHQDVPAAGTWCFSWPFHIASLTVKGKLFGFGIRYNYGDGNYWSLRAVWRSN